MSSFFRVKDVLILQEIPRQARDDGIWRSLDRLLSRPKFSHAERSGETSSGLRMSSFFRRSLVGMTARMSSFFRRSLDRLLSRPKFSHAERSGETSSGLRMSSFFRRSLDRLGMTARIWRSLTYVRDDGKGVAITQGKSINLYINKSYRVLSSVIMV